MVWSHHRECDVEAFSVQRRASRNETRVPQARAFLNADRSNLNASYRASRDVTSKDLSLPERPAQYQLVGAVTAYQGDDA